MFDGSLSPRNEDEGETIVMEGVFGKINKAKNGGKPNQPWAPKPKKPKKHWGVIDHAICTRQ